MQKRVRNGALVFGLLLLINTFYSEVLYSQNVAITDDDLYTANPSAMLDVKSTSKGLLIPRLSTAQREAINPAVKGLLVFDTDKNEFYYFSSEEWLALPQVSSSSGVSDALFAVKNSAGDTIFAVYNDGVKVVVPYGTKGKVGGFAVSGRSPTKAGEEEYLLVTPDSTRVFINEVDVKGKVGGFAVSGRSPTKSIINDYLSINADSTRIYVNDSLSTKGKVGGFAVSGRSPTKAGTMKFMDMTSSNYFIGHESGKNNLSGLYNAFMGYQSGQANTTGSLNSFFGFQAGYKNSSGSDNLFLGYQSGFSNTTGERNLFLGRESGKSNIDGIYNQFFGYQSGYSNTSGGHNNFIGYQAGYHNTSGWTNIFIGGFSGYDNISGTQNVFLGSSTGANNTTGFNNVYIGHRCGLNNVTGARNIFIGFESGLNETGSDKLYIDNSDTSTPLIFGDFSADYVRINGLFYTTNNAAINNTWISDQAIEINGAGMGNRTSLIDWHGDDTYTDFCFRIIRYNTGPNAPSYIVHRGTGEFNIQAQDAGFITISTTATERMRITSGGLIGLGRTPTANRLEVNGNASKSAIGDWLANSDKRIKTDIQDINNAYETMLKLHPVKFKYTDDYKKNHEGVEDRYYYNYIAQEFQQIFPESVKGSGEFIQGSKDEILQMDAYNAQIVSIKAVQELIIENREQQEQIQELEERNMEINNQLLELNKRLEKIEKVEK